MLLVSACLLGHKTRYDGTASRCEILRELAGGQDIMSVCPELFGGLQGIRPSAEIVGGDGNAVLDGKARVLNACGDDVTAQFIAGAQRVLELAQKNNVTAAVLKARSPSCGCGAIYDGSFTHVTIPGDGVAAALLKRHDIVVYTEENLPPEYRPTKNSIEE